MPLPKPKQDETKSDFIERCLSDDNIQSEFPTQEQRLGVCHSLWDKYGQNALEKLGIKFTINSKYDPSNTYRIRENFRKQFYKKARQIRGIVRNTIVQKDIFNLENPVEYPKLAQGISDYSGKITGTAKQKADDFINWLDKVEKEIILEAKVNNAGTVMSQSGWYKNYIESSYIKGIKESAQVLRENGIGVDKIDPSKILRQPTFRGSVKTFNDMTERYIINAWNETDIQIKNNIKRTFMEEYTKDQSVSSFKDKMTQVINDRIDKIGYNRSRVIAQTEIVRANAESRLDYFEYNKIPNVTIKAEYSTAFDSRVCPVCESWEGEVMTIKEARGLIPLHPSCRCMYLPIVNK